MTNSSRTEIKEPQIEAQLRFADGMVKQVSWSPKQNAPAPGQMHHARLIARVQDAPSISLIESLKLIRKDGSELLGWSEYRALYHTRRGIQIALAAAEEYRKMAGIDTIGDIRSLSNDKKTEIQEKQRTAAAITLHTLARFVEEGLADASDESGHREHVVLPEVVYDDPHSALRCVLFYLAHNVANPKVNNDKALDATVGIFFEKILEDIASRKETFKHLDQFASTSFHVEADDFTIEGLERHDTGVASVEFNRVDMASIVGNADAKHFVRRLAQRLVCYNVREQMNVFQKLGGIMPVWMGSGKPGTGKSMIIAALATMLDDLCKARGIPFLFHPLPDNLIDSYQGNSAKNMVTWMRALSVPDRIVFAAIDDAENVLEDRTRQGVSEGVRAVIGVFLRYTEGAYAIARGNSTVGTFTNLPEQFDPAVRSRIQGRTLIDGAKTVEDALDQGQLSRRKYADQPGFINLKDPDWYTYQSKQGELKSLAEADQTKDAPENPIMRELFDSVVRDYDVRSHEFFGRLFVSVMNRYPAFSSRDMRNIDSAVDLRVMDFDLPEEWFSDNSLFHDHDLARQTAMVLELRNGNMKGLKFGDIARQEWVRYLDSYAMIADAQFDREVTARIHEHRIRKEVERRLMQKEGA